VSGWFRAREAPLIVLAILAAWLCQESILKSHTNILSLENITETANPIEPYPEANAALLNLVDGFGREERPNYTFSRAYAHLPL